MRKIFSISLAKMIIAASRMVGNSGSALPGLVAEKISSNLLGDFSVQFEQGVVLITGTNGKTTTVKMIVGMLEELGYKVFTNKTGSNFTRGILSALIDESSLNGKINFDIGVIEMDEAYSGVLARQLQPAVVTVTNVMRDQLDRYGEVDHTAKLISKALTYSRGAVLNADDPPVAKLGEALDKGATVTYFGANDEIKKVLPSDDELLGRDKSSVYEFDGNTDVILESINKQKFTISVDGSKHETEMLLEGAHNGVNAAAAVATVWHVLGDRLDIGRAVQSLSNIKPAFGRGERIRLQDRTVHIALAKNPGGFNQNIRTFVSESTRVVLVLVNDNYADSRDVSWLWDVDFDLLKKHAPTLIVGGNRAYDMALRFQYMGLDVDEVDQSISIALEHALSAGASTEDVTVFPTYTAMLELRKILKTYTDDVEDIW